MRNWRLMASLVILLFVTLVSLPFALFKLSDGGPAIPLTLIFLCFVAFWLSVPRRGK